MVHDQIMFQRPDIIISCFIALSRIISFHNLVRRISPDIVLVHYAQGLWAWLAPLAKRPVVVTVMGGDVLFDEQGRPTWMERTATGGLIRASRLVLCKTGYLRQKVVEMNPEVQTQVYSWGVDRNIFHPNAGENFRSRLGISPDTLVIFSPRVMQPLYRIDIILRGFARVLTEKSSALLLLATFRAYPEYQEHLRSQCRQMHMEDKVVFLPDLTPDEMAAHLAAADISVSIPTSDGLPQTFLESAACKTAMLMSNLPNYREQIIHGQHAWLTEVTESDVAKGMLYLAHNQALRNRLAGNALDLLEEMEQSQGMGQVARALRRVSDGKHSNLPRFLPLWQLFLALAMILAGRPVAGRTGQPVCHSIREWLAGFKAVGATSRSPLQQRDAGKRR